MQQNTQYCAQTFYITDLIQVLTCYPDGKLFYFIHLKYVNERNSIMQK